MRKKVELKQPFILWFTGLPCSGKTTLSQKLENILNLNNISLKVLDGDTLRQNFSKNLGYSQKDRQQHNLRVAKMAHEIYKTGTPVCVALISPYLEIRKKIKDSYENVLEVYLNCNLETCKQRDIKGMYKKALKGGIKNFTGVDAPYEKPENPEIAVQTGKYNTKNCADQIITYLRDNSFIE
jgi:adenylylsulfate kinase